MKGLHLGLVLFVAVLCAVVAAATATTPTTSAVTTRSGATHSCTKAERARRAHRVATYKRQMKPARRAYFKTHRSSRARAKFVRAQNVHLKALQRALDNCRPTPPPPPSSPGSNCFASPGACGFPDPAAGNVGVPAGTTLTPSGSITVNTAGTVVNGLDVSGTIIVNAQNVTIKNTRVTGTGAGCGPTNTCGNFVIRVACACTVTISNVELTANSPTTVEHGIRNANGGTINVDHVYQHGNIDALCFCGNGSISDSYSLIHLAIALDHLENIYLDDASLRIVHNTLLNQAPQTANIFGNTNNGSDGPCENHLTIDKNLLAGGGFSIYPCAHGTSVGSSSSQITNNRFARCKTPEYQGGGGTWLCTGGPDSFGYYPRGGSFGYLASAYCRTSPAHTWSGNVWDDNNATINC